MDIPRAPPETITDRPGGPKERNALESAKSTQNQGPAAGSLAAILALAKLKAADEKFEDEEPNYLEVEVPYTNVLQNLEQSRKLYTQEAI